MAQAYGEMCAGGVSVLPFPMYIFAFSSSSEDFLNGAR